MAVSLMMISPCSLLQSGSPKAELVRNSALTTARPVHCPRGARVRRVATTVCKAGAGAPDHVDPPKLEPFSQSRISRSMRDRSFLQKAEDAMSDKCTELEGEAAYQCWEALFEYENIKEEAESECQIALPDDRENACKPLERLENMVRQSGGVNSLISNVRMAAKIKDAKKQKAGPSENEWLEAVSSTTTEGNEGSSSEGHEYLEDGGIPKTPAELQEEIDALLPESQFSLLLKRGGHHSPDHDVAP